MDSTQVNKALQAAERGVLGFLDSAREAGSISDSLYRSAKANVVPNLRSWLEDPEIDRISPHAKEGIVGAIEAERWSQLVNAYRQSLRFGTGGIRGMMAFDLQSIERLASDGLDAPILKGPNTMNNIVVLRVSAGVAKFGREKGFSKIVIGYDSRVRGGDFARVIASLFLSYGYEVYFFDDVCPYPEVTYAIPSEAIKADMGILISASHNDYRYNGYKLSGANGSQFDPSEREELYGSFIAKATTADVKLTSFADAPADKLFFLGGAKPRDGFDYAGKEANVIDMHRMHLDHISTFILQPKAITDAVSSGKGLVIGYCPFHGAGRLAVPRLLEGAGFRDVLSVHSRQLGEANGFFPAFRNQPGMEQQPDPGDRNAAQIAVRAFKSDYAEREAETDVIIGTDPDADRCAVICPVPEEQRFIYDDDDWALIPADEVWALLMWYRLKFSIENGADPKKLFITMSHTTSDAIAKVAESFGVGVVKTWVGFGALAAATRGIWDGKFDSYTELSGGRRSHTDAVCDPIVFEVTGMDAARTINVGTMEQSNGFSILGGSPPDARSLGTNGHVRDKDGVFASLLSAEVAAWAKANGHSLLELIDTHVYQREGVGLFVNGYEADPLEGEYPGIQGDTTKLTILRRALGLYQMAKAGGLEIAGMPVVDADIYRTGKYDHIYPPTYDFQFPDEGIRFFFSEDKLNHFTLRPSGTGNSLRLHTQLHEEPDVDNYLKQKYLLRFRSHELITEMRRLIDAPRRRYFP